MASALPPVRGAAFSFEISLISQADTDTFQDNPTLAAGDVKIIKDGALDGNIDTLPTAVTSLTRVLTVPLSADEMTADRVTVLFHDAAGNEWQDAVVTIYTAARTIDDLATPTNITAGTINSVLGTVGGLTADAQQDVADALKLTPTAGDPATGSVYELLAAIETLAGAGVSGGGEHAGTVDHWGGGTGDSVAFSDHWDIITAINPNTAGGYNPPGDFGAVRLHLASPYVAGAPIGLAILNLGLQGADGNFAIKIELSAASPSLWGTTYADRTWGTEVVLVTGTNYNLELHAIDVTDLVAELLASVPVETSISYLVFGISPTGGNSPSVSFSDGATFWPSATLTEALVVSGLTQQDVADAGLLAPAGGTPATGSLYDLLAAPANEPAQLDWRAWETPSGALADLYDDNAVDELTHSGTTLAAEGATGFAAWVLQEFDDALFVGVGKTPMNHIAAVVGSIATAGAAPTLEYALPEEGVSAMTVGSDGKLYVAGVDERTNTGTSSIYIRTAAGVWTRKQTVTGWQHICGIREDGLLWIAGQGASSTLMYSSDGGDTWVDTDLPLGRAYDAIRLGSYVIATHLDAFETYTVQRSATVPAFSWSVLPEIDGGIGRMVIWNGVVAGTTQGGSVFTVSNDGSRSVSALPFQLRQTYNNLAVDTDGYLCVLGETGIWRTNDLANWKQVWSFLPADTVRSLGTWGDDLVVSTDGATATILARPASPEAAQQQMLRDALKLAASPGSPATGSTDADLAAIVSSQSDVETAISGLALTLSGIDGALDDIYGYLYGDGPITYEYVLTSEVDDVTPLANVRVRVTTDADGKQFVCENYTNDQGAVVFHLSAGTYYFFRYRQNTRFSINPDVEVIS